jgi:hypothetical protein
MDLEFGTTSTVFFYSLYLKKSSGIECFHTKYFNDPLANIRFDADSVIGYYALIVIYLESFDSRKVHLIQV